MLLCFRETQEKCVLYPYEDNIILHISRRLILICIYIDIDAATVYECYFM